MDAIKERDIEEKELRKITEAYRKMNPTNRCFIVSASGMLLASQQAGEMDQKSKEEADNHE